MRRWSTRASFLPEWEVRARRIASLVPRCSHVLEFGAGLCRLGEWLPPDCTYTPSDFINRVARTLVLDLNGRPLPDITGFRADVAVFAGVLEYLLDVPAVIEWLAPQVPMCIASYECSMSEPGRLARMLDGFSRASQGWVNAYRQEELIAVFTRAAFRCRAITDWENSGPGRIFVFEK